jgi:hypothetical protein
MDHLELIVKDGEVRIPSIFMFDNSRELEQFLESAKKMDCSVVFENENIEVLPNKDDGIVCAIIAIYKPIIDNHEIGNAYLRYLGNIDKMSWDKVQY